MEKRKVYNSQDILEVKSKVLMVAWILGMEKKMMLRETSSFLGMQPNEG